MKEQEIKKDDQQEKYDISTVINEIQADLFDTQKYLSIVWASMNDDALEEMEEKKWAGAKYMFLVGIQELVNEAFESLHKALETTYKYAG